MKKLGADDVDGTTFYYSASVPNFEAMEHLALQPGPFVMFIAADARSVSADVVARVAGRLLDGGLVVVCVWGPDCERVHDIFDEEYVGDGIATRSLGLMTTWHAHESLEDAVEFFALAGRRLADEDNPAGSQLAVAVDNTEWASAIERVLLRFCN